VLPEVLVAGDALPVRAHQGQQVVLLEPLEDGRYVAVGAVAGIAPALAVAATAVAAAAAVADGVVGAGAVVGPAVVRPCLAFGAVGGAWGFGIGDLGLGLRVGRE